MITFPGSSTETEGRRGSQTRLVEGGRYLGIPENRCSAIAAGRRPTHHEAGRGRVDGPRKVMQ